MTYLLNSPQFCCPVRKETAEPLGAGLVLIKENDTGFPFLADGGFILQVWNVVHFKFSYLSIITADIFLPKYKNQQSAFFHFFWYFLITDFYLFLFNLNNFIKF